MEDYYGGLIMEDNLWRTIMADKMMANYGRHIMADKMMADKMMATFMEDYLWRTI